MMMNMTNSTIHFHVFDLHARHGHGENRYYQNKMPAIFIIPESGTSVIHCTLKITN